MPGSEKSSHSFRVGPGIVLTILAMITIPAVITLNRVHDAGTLKISSSDPTPYGYTWSLLLFIVPIIVIAGWLFPQERIRLPQRAFWRTISILVPFGFALDFFFAHKFFVYPNRQATLGIGAPALGGPVPVEEYIFYFSGFIAILLIYIWLDEFWLAAYSVPDYAGEAKKEYQTAGVSPDFGYLRRAAGDSCHHLQKTIFTRAGWFSRLFDGAGYRRTDSISRFLSHGESLHQLACLQFSAVIRFAGQPALGGHAGFAVRLVGLSAESDAGSLRKSLVKPSR